MPKRWLIGLVTVPICAWAWWTLSPFDSSGLQRPPAPRPIPQRPRLAAKDQGVPAKLLELDDAGSPLRIVTQDGYRVELHLASQSVTVSSPEAEAVGRSDLQQFQRDDTVETIEAGVELNPDDGASAKLPLGAKLRVAKPEKTRVSVVARVGGEMKQGWVEAGKLKLAAVDSRLTITPVGRDYTKFVSAAQLMQKAKQFDDGLYAAVELAAQDGLGDFAGKSALLSTLTAALSKESSTRTGGVVAGAALLGGAIQEVPASLYSIAAYEATEFDKDQLRSKPLGFYTWNDRLTAIFRQDRLLQTELLHGDGPDAAVQALRNDVAARKTYTAYMQLIERLTNPSNYDDLRKYVADAGPMPSDAKLRIFPPSRSYEAALVLQMFDRKVLPDGNVIPEGFDLMNELIARITSGRLDVTPKPDSGWYDHQTYALAALLKPELPGEPDRLRFDAGYRKHLTEMFKGALALARETHVKQLESPSVTTSALRPEQPRVKITIRPEFTVEPLAEAYRRRADSYRFVRAVLEEAFGAEALKKMHRLTADGYVELDLAAELQRMTEIFDGAALVAAREAGLPTVDTKLPAKSQSADTYLEWAASLASDDDLGRDARMMVPVFYDTVRKKTKVWVFLGWQARSVTFRFSGLPSVKVFDSAGNSADGPVGPELIWQSSSELVYTPVMAEVYVSKLLDRDEFRKHCDAFVTRTAILANLE